MSSRATWRQSYLAVGKLQNIISNIDLDEATKSLTRARAMLEPLAAANPLEPLYQSSLADCYSEIAIIQARLDGPARAWSSSRKPKPSSKS